MKKRAIYYIIFILFALPACLYSPEAYYHTRAVDKALEQNLSEPVRSLKPVHLLQEDGDGGLAEYTEIEAIITAYTSSIEETAFSSVEAIDEMLNWVINCESSGKMETIGQEGEIGILQWKPATWEFFKAKYNFNGSIMSPTAQIELFLMTTPEEKEQHWTCYRKWLALDN